MFSFQYRLSEADFVAFNRYVVSRHRKSFVLQVLASGAGLAVVFFAFLRSETHDTRASLITAVVVGLLGSLLYFLYFRSQTKASIAKQLANDPYALDAREIIVSVEGFRERTAVNDSFHAWQGLESVGITRTHVFLHLTSLTAFIIPGPYSRRRLSRSSRHRFQPRKSGARVPNPGMQRTRYARR